MRYFALVTSIVAASMLADFTAARATSLDLSSDQTTYGWPFIDAVNNGIVIVYVMAGVSPGPGLSQVKFAVPTPPGLMLVEVSPPPVTGSVETGTVVNLTACGYGTRFVMQLIYLVTNVNSCTPLIIRSYQSAYGVDVEGADCHGNPVLVEHQNVVLHPPGLGGCGAPTVPSNPWPPDNATGVSLSPALSWESEPTAGTGLGVFEMRLFLGTVPDPPLAEYYALPPQSVGPLLPGTTYYWKIVSYTTDFGSSVGPVWRFTTAGSPVPVQSSTWGSIKAMYR